MEKKIIGAIIVGLGLVITGIIFFVNMSGDPAQPASQPITTTSESATTEPETPTAVITADEVAMHDNASNCWTIVNNTVYDITSYIPRHPGGSEILRACGANATTLFESRTTEDGQEVGSGTPHSSSANSILSGFEVGPLEQ